MDVSLNSIAEAACVLAAEMPVETVRFVAKLIGESADVVAAQRAIGDRVAQPYYRELALDFLRVWAHSGVVSHPQAISLCLLAASQSACEHRDKQSVELVWTGPDSGTVPLRRTEQVLLQVLDSATTQITLVSYAVYRIPRVADALVRAAKRGVTIRVVVETPDVAEGEREYDTIRALGDEVLSVCQILYWPAKHRPLSGAGRPGILHVKCLIADRKWLFVSSANLTDYAFTINMELGVLVTGMSLADRVDNHFDSLISEGVLVSLPRLRHPYTG